MKRLLPYVPVALVTVGLAAYAISGVLERCGHPAVPLDDAFIHFQYAKRFATGHLFSFSEGDGYSSGATSFLWPMLLAPFYLLGLRDLAIIWAAWALGFLALGALALETYRLALPLAGKWESLGAGAMVLCFGGYLWCAASGMEVVPLAWVLALGLRKCIEWGEAMREQRSPKDRRFLLVVAVLAPFVRPEGMLVSLLAALTLVLFPAVRGLSHPDSLSAPQGRRGVRRFFEERSPALIALIGVFAIPLLNLALTGQARSSTTLVKWLPGNPYYGHGAALAAAVRENVRILVVTLLDGREWSAVYIPSGARPFALAALVAIPAAGWLGDRTWRAFLICVMALAIALPCTYLTFLWNRLRYLWPFAFAWFVGLACLSRCVAELMGAISARLRMLGGVVSFLFACALGGQLSWTRDDLASSSSAIDRQQVELGRWAAEYLPSSARIGLNDTGAIAYLSGKKTFDVVGLTTPGEAPYWVAGGGSRFEHYEKLYLASPERLPTHFIVYPQWMACDAVLGDPLHEATVLDQTILGGTTMIAYEARYDWLGSGARPLAPPKGQMLDELDVADLESEAAHAYHLGSARETDNAAVSYETDDGVIAEGARLHRASDSFVMHGADGKPSILIARLMADAATEVEVYVSGLSLARVPVRSQGFTEVSVTIPPELAHDPLVVSLVAPPGGSFGSAHYWLYSQAHEAH